MDQKVSRKQGICNTYCIVDGCSSKKAKNKNISYHIFPKPKQSFVFVENQFGFIEKLDKREAWIKRLGLTRKITETTRICSLHFSKDQFFLPNFASHKARLKKSAVPTPWALFSDSSLKLEQTGEACEEVLKTECSDYVKAEETTSVPSTFELQGHLEKQTLERCTGEEKIVNRRILKSNVLPPEARKDNFKTIRSIQVETGFSSVNRIVPSLYVKSQISERRSENLTKMPGSTCSVKSCNNNTIKCKFSAISFHHFPKRNLFRKQWIRFCQQPKGWTPKPHCMICSVHFEPDAFDQKSGNLMSWGSETAKTILKPNAVPKILDGGILEVESFIETESDDNLEITVDASTQTSFQTDELTSLRNAYKELENKFHAQEKLITVLRNGNKSLLISTVEKELYYKNLEKSKEELEKKLKMFENSSVTHAAFNLKIKEAVSKTLTANQVDAILGVKKKVRWNRDEFAKALSLRYLSRKAYSFMRGENFPLPHLRTLERYAQMIDLRGGLLKDVLQFLKIASLNMTLKEKAVVLVHVEMKVKRIYEYDKNCDEIIGPHDFVQVVVARSLFGNWKQPIYVGFDKTMSKELLFEIISALHDISFDVVAVVGDCESANQNTLKELNVSLTKSYFHHPVTDDKIFCFIDAPQLLELIRNWFLNIGFQLSSGHIIEKDLLEDLISRGIPDTEVLSDFTLSEKHLKVEKDDKQNATLASQLFSNFTAAAITNHSSSEESENLAYFIQLVNDWFEIMSSTDLKESPFKKPFRGQEEQVEKLEEIYHVFENMLCIGKNSLQVFQKNILLSLTSLEQLFVEMTGRYGINSISTSKLNQDVVQKLIVQLRGRGSLDDHPTPMNLLHRLRIEILGKTPGLVQTKTNASQCDDKEEYLIAKVFSVAEVEPAVDVLDSDMTIDDDFPGTSSDFSIDDQLPFTSNDITVDDDLPSTSSDMTFDDLPTTSSDMTVDNLPSTSTDLKANQIEEDGLSYLSRWLAEKFSKVLPESGTETSHEEHSYQKDSSASEGLTEPSKNLLKNLKILEMHFNKINKGQFFSKTLVLKRMLFQLKKLVDLPEEITRTFLQQRILIRLKKLNQIIRSNEIKKKRKISVITKSKKVVVLDNRLLKFTRD